MIYGNIVIPFTRAGRLNKESSVSRFARGSKLKKSSQLLAALEVVDVAARYNRQNFLLTLAKLEAI